MSYTLDLEKIVRKVIEDAARGAVEYVISDHCGRGIDDEIKQAIKEKAKAILNEPEVEQKVREAIIYWVRNRVSA